MRAPPAGGALPADGAIYHRAAARVVPSFLSPAATQERNALTQCKEPA